MDALWDSDDGGAGGGESAGEIIASGSEESGDGDGARSGSGDDSDSDAAAARGAEAELAPELVLVDTHVAREEVLARIEAAAATLLRGLAGDAPSVPPLELASRRQAAAVHRKRLLARRDGPSCVRLWRVLAECHANLTARRSATQRELYCACCYRLPACAAGCGAAARLRASAAPARVSSAARAHVLASFCLRSRAPACSRS
jgi:hypothetical protein